MHLSEFALRDFIGVERLSRWTGVAVFDDILPRDVVEAARDRRTLAWTGDVYKVLDILATHRPDLICLRVGTFPTGLLLVLGLDPESRVLSARYDMILEEAVVPDPQKIPAEVLERRGVLEPEAVLASRVWPVLRDLREQGTSRRSRSAGATARRAQGPRRGQRRETAAALARVRLTVCIDGTAAAAGRPGTASPGGRRRLAADQDPSRRVRRDQRAASVLAALDRRGVREAGDRHLGAQLPRARGQRPAGGRGRGGDRDAGEQPRPYPLGSRRPCRASPRSARGAGTRSRRRRCAATRSRWRGAAVR